MPAGFVSGRHSQAFGTVFRVEYDMIRPPGEKIRLFRLIVQSSHEGAPEPAEQSVYRTMPRRSMTELFRCTVSESNSMPRILKESFMNRDTPME